MSRDRQRRLLRVLELVSTRRISTQEELAAALSAEGWEVTQSSASRDIQALGLVKLRGAYAKPARSARASDPDETRLIEGVLLVQAAGEHLIVVHTPPGEAQRVALALDRLAWPEIVGTLAGDDTIFVATADRGASRSLLRRLRPYAGRS